MFAKSSSRESAIRKSKDLLLPPVYREQSIKISKGKSLKDSRGSGSEKSSKTLKFMAERSAIQNPLQSLLDKIKETK